MVTEPIPWARPRRTPFTRINRATTPPHAAMLSNRLVAQVSGEIAPAVS